MPCYFSSVVILWFLSFCAYSSIGQARECLHDQKYLLQLKILILKESKSVYCRTRFGFPRPLKVASWNTSTSSDCCTWSGVKCNPDTGDVIGINLGCKALRSSFMYSSKLLSSIKTNGRLKNNPLDFSPHKTSTSSSTGTNLLFQNLSKLRILIFDGLEMSSVDPRLFSNLPSSVQLLSLYSCKLQGYFPEEVFLLPNLKFLDLSFNVDLHGHLPRSNWSSPLEILDLSSTSFSGELPTEIGNLKSLQVLWLYKCNFTGLVPASIGNLTRLTRLNLSVNKSKGQIPPTFSNLQRLILFSLSSNYFSGPIPDMFTNKTKLVCLDFSCNMLNISIPVSSLSVPSMTDLDLSNNILGGHINRVHANSLKSIILFGNQLEGSIPPSILYLSNLTNLLLSSNRFGGLFDLKMLAQMKKMETLDLSHNMITLSNVDYSSLSLSRCNLIGFPAFVRMARNLTTLDLSSNRIWGRIPAWMGEVRSGSLAYLNVSHNLLTSLEQVPWVNLHSINIQGLILPQLPNPSSLGKLSELKLSDMFSIELAGRIPSELTQLTYLAILSLSHNHLVRPIPYGNRFNKFPADMYSGNTGWLCGFPLSKTCSIFQNTTIMVHQIHKKDSLLSEHVMEFLGVGCLCGVVIGWIIEGLLCRGRHNAIERKFKFFTSSFNFSRGPFVAVAVVMILIQFFDPAASTLAFSNQCSTPIAICNINASGPIIVQPNDAHLMEPSASLVFWAYKNSGDMCTNMENPVVTLGEIDFDNGGYSYSVSVAYGYNLGVKIMALGRTSCLPAACTAKLEDCPDDLKARGPNNVVIACNPPNCTESKMLCSLYSRLMGNSQCQKPGSSDQYSSKDARCNFPGDLAIIFKCD